MPDIEVAGLVTKLSIDDSQIEQKMASLSRQMQMAKSEFTAASSGLDKYGDSAAGLKLKSESLTKQLELQGVKVAKLHEEHAKAVQEKGKDAKETQNLEVRLNKAVAEYNNLDAQLRKTNKELAYQTSQWKHLGDNLEAAGKRMQTVGKGMETAGKTLTRSVTTPILAAGAAVLKFGGDFEQSMNRVSALSSATGNDFERLKTQAKDLGRTTKFSASQAADAMGFLAMAGFKTNDILGTMPSVLQLAASAQIDLGRAADITSNILTGYGMKVEDLGKANDVLVKAMTSANVDLSMLGESFKYAGPLAKAAGVQFEEAAAAIGMMGNAGIQGSMAGTALRGAITRLLKPTKEVAETMFDLGLKVTDSKGNLLPLVSIVEQLEKKGASTAQMMALFGQRAGPAMQALVDQGSDALRKFTRELESSGGTADRIAKTQMKGLKGSITEMKSAVEGVAIAVAESGVLETVTETVKGFTAFIQKLAETNPALLKTATQYALFAAAAGPVLFATGKITTSFGSVIEVAGKAAKAIAAKQAAVTAMSATNATAASSTGLLSGGITGLISPVGLAVAGIAALGAGAFLLHQHMKQDAIPAVYEFGDAVSASTEKAVTAYLNLNDQATSALNQLKWSSTAVTGDMAAQVTQTFTDMAAQIVAGLEKSRVDGVAVLEKFFAESKNISVDEQSAMLQALNEGYDKRKKTIEEQKARIKEIMETASRERRALHHSEQKEIAKIQEEMKNAAIFALTETQLEQRAILERMRLDAENLTARQAADVVKNSAEQRQKAVEEAEKQYNESVKQFIFMRDETKDITTEQAEALIREAKRMRDEVVAQAEDMHKKIVSEARTQAQAHIDAVDWETGEILSKWQVFWRKLTGMHSEARATMNPATGFYDLLPPGAGQAATAKTTTSNTGANRKNLDAWNDPRFIPQFDDGGRVPGPIGAPRIILAHGGETVVPTHKPDYQVQRGEVIELTVVQPMYLDGKEIGRETAKYVFDRQTFRAAGFAGVTG